jgi:hypothetical protein
MIRVWWSSIGRRPSSLRPGLPQRAAGPVGPRDGHRLAVVRRAEPPPISFWSTSRRFQRNFLHPAERPPHWHAQLVATNAVSSATRSWANLCSDCSRPLQ